MYDCVAADKAYILGTYGRFPVVLEKGEGCYLYDIDGKKYLDMCAGIAVNALGYNHPKLTAALQEQVTKLLHVSNLYYTQPQTTVAKLLVENSPFTKVFFCNSGTEANEAAIKIARKYGKKISQDKYKIVSTKQSFHGRTMGALSATGQKKYQQDFMPLVDGFVYANYNDIASVEAVMDESVCAVILEVIQGEGGIIVGDSVYLQQVQQLCKKYNALLLIDEVQTGIGRTGSLFAYEQFGIMPDIVSLAKGLGGGVPIGAVLVGDTADILVPGDHGTTFGGNALATTAAKVVLEEVLVDGFLAQIQEVGAYFRSELVKLQEQFSCIAAVRGMGLMQGIQLTIPTKEVIAGCMEEGMLVLGAGIDVVRFVPPLIITKEQIDEAIATLRKVLASV